MRRDSNITSCRRCLVKKIGTKKIDKQVEQKKDVFEVMIPSDDKKKDEEKDFLIF